MILIRFKMMMFIVDDEDNDVKYYDDYSFIIIRLLKIIMSMFRQSKLNMNPSNVFRY